MISKLLIIALVTSDNPILSDSDRTRRSLCKQTPSDARLSRIKDPYVIEMINYVLQHILNMCD